MFPFSFLGSGIDAQAQAHYNRVIADGGLVPSGLDGVNTFFTTVKGIYATSDITTAISVGLDAQVLGYKLGAGSGTTAGQAAQKLYSCSGASGDVVQTTAASQPLLLVHDGVNNYYQGVGVGFNYCFSPLGSMDFTGDFTLICKFSPLSGIGGEFGAANNISFAIGSNGVLSFYANSTQIVSTVATTFSDKFYRVSRSGNNFTFSTSLDGVTYTQLGAVVVNSVVISNGTALRVGNGSGLDVPITGKIYRFLFYKDSTATTIIADFSPNNYNAATSQSSFISSGIVWTINTGTVTTGYKGVLVDKTIMQGDGVNDRLLSSTLTSRSTFSRFCATNPLNINIFKGIVGANTNDRHYLYATATDVAIYNGVALNFSGEQANKLALYEGDYNGVSGSTLLNNTTSSSGNVGSGSSTVVELFALVDGSFGNVVINTLIDMSSIATTQQKTDMYNYIRSINNNAF
jgi:hypothetical protein